MYSFARATAVVCYPGVLIIEVLFPVYLCELKM